MCADAAASVESARFVSAFHSSSTRDANAEARLYFSIAVPVFSAMMPLDATARMYSSGSSTLLVSRTGQYVYVLSRPVLQPRIAGGAWLAPNVPTPRAPR